MSFTDSLVASYLAFMFVAGSLFGWTGKDSPLAGFLVVILGGLVFRTSCVATVALTRTTPGAAQSDQPQTADDVLASSPIRRGLPKGRRLRLRSETLRSGLVINRLAWPASTHHGVLI